MNFLIRNPSPNEKSLDAEMLLAGGFVYIGPGFSLFAAQEDRLTPKSKAPIPLTMEFTFIQFFQI